METLEKHFDQCFKPKEDARSYQAVYELTQEQSETISTFRYQMQHIAGVTLDRVRYITNNHVLICTYAIALMDEWQVFKALFETLGDNWKLKLWAKQAEQIDPPSTPEPSLQAIKSWEEGSDYLKSLLAVDGIALFKNSKNALVAVDAEYAEFVSSLSFGLNEVENPADPIPLTHCQSAGFAGILMPLQLVEADRKRLLPKCQETVKLLEGSK